MSAASSGAVTAIVLAAGKGKRMKSRTPKVLHTVCGRPMLEYAIAAAHEAGAADALIVASPELEPEVRARGLRAVVQDSQDGTGHAMQLAMRALGHRDGDILVVSGDMPLVPAELLRKVIAARATSGAALAMVTARVQLPTDFGRIVRRNGRVARIVENADATAAEKAIDEVNAGIYCFNASALARHLESLARDNAQGELYLTDCVATMGAAGEAVETVECDDPSDVIGVNNRAELARARALMQQRILERHMLAGVTIVDPSATYVDAGVIIGEDTVIEPQTHLRGATEIGRRCAIGPGALLENAKVADDARVIHSVLRECVVGERVTIGPFAHLRGGTVVEEEAHIGNFVEAKKTRVGRRAKAGHLAYLGDADVGDDANIGAGTITCNYDGKRKNATKIGKRAFIGSNSSLVAPLDVGDDALTGAGAVVTHDVPAGERVAGNPAKLLPKKAPSNET